MGFNPACHYVSVFTKAFEFVGLRNEMLGKQFHGVLSCLPQTAGVAPMLDTREQIRQHPVHLCELEVQVADFAEPKFLIPLL